MAKTKDLFENIVQILREFHLGTPADQSQTPRLLEQLKDQLQDDEATNADQQEAIERLKAENADLKEKLADHEQRLSDIENGLQDVDDALQPPTDTTTGDATSGETTPPSDTPSAEAPPAQPSDETAPASDATSETDGTAVTDDSQTPPPAETVDDPSAPQSDIPPNQAPLPESSDATTGEPLPVEPASTRPPAEAQDDSL